MTEMLTLEQRVALLEVVLGRVNEQTFADLPEQYKAALASERAMQ